jgi:hypothetical protein
VPPAAPPLLLTEEADAIHGALMRRADALIAGGEGEAVNEASRMAPKRDRAIDIARELVRHIDAGHSKEEIATAIDQAFPGATAAEIERARVIGLDEIDLWLENLRENAGKVFDMLMSGAPAEEIGAAANRICSNLTAETLFPKPDKAKS